LRSQAFESRAQGLGTTFSAHTKAGKCPQVLGDAPPPPPSLSKERILRVWLPNSKIQILEFGNIHLNFDAIYLNFGEFALHAVGQVASPLAPRRFRVVLSLALLLIEEATCGDGQNNYKSETASRRDGAIGNLRKKSRGTLYTNGPRGMHFIFLLTPMRGWTSWRGWEFSLYKAGGFE